MSERGQGHGNMKRLGRFWSAVLTLIVIYALIRWGIPSASREITTLPFPLPVPGALIFIYMTLALVAMFLLVTFSDEAMADFLRPIKRLLRAEFGKLPRAAVLVLVPLIAGWQVYEVTVPRVELPVSLRIQHPSSNFPKKFEDLKNPYTDPPEAEIVAFIEQAKANDVALITQVATDVERWLEENPDGHMLSFLPT
ncbi:MAG: hypothetical protein QF726_05105, partial [Alphaproteobacteria bacterium]|nr:hypothetical protein [Alphaproteobacteria bacterium]